jgi:hypothetical protein
MLLDIYNGTALDSVSIQNGAGLALSVSDSFDLYPGTYEEKWNTNKDTMIDKISGLTDWQCSCLTIWAVDFWRSGAYQEEDAVNRYVTGKLSAATRMQDALKMLSRSVELMEKTKGAFKSPAIAEARSQAEKAGDILKEMLEF